jgi:hypothetical protein
MQLAATRIEFEEAEAGMGTRAPTKKAFKGKSEGVKDSPILPAPVENDHASARVDIAPEWMLLKEDWETMEKVCRIVYSYNTSHDCTHAIMCMRRSMRRCIPTCTMYSLVDRRRCVVRYVCINSIAASWRVRSRRQRESGKVSRSSCNG